MEIAVSLTNLLESDIRFTRFVFYCIDVYIVRLMRMFQISSINMRLELPIATVEDCQESS